MAGDPIILYTGGHTVNTYTHTSHVGNRKFSTQFVGESSLCSPIIKIEAEEYVEIIPGNCFKMHTIREVKTPSRIVFNAELQF